LFKKIECLDLKDVANQHVPEAISMDHKEEKDVPIEKHD